MTPRIPNYGYNPYFSPPTPSSSFHRGYPYQRPNYYPRYSPHYNENKNENVVWVSEWTQWLPASKINWTNLNERTFIPDIPPSFGGRVSNQDVTRYKGLVNKYFSGIFPTDGDGSK